LQNYGKEESDTETTFSATQKEYRLPADEWWNGKVHHHHHPFLRRVLKNVVAKGEKWGPRVVVGKIGRKGSICDVKLVS
jgi:hypothetical protein